MAVAYLLQERRIVARTLDADAGPVPAVFLASLDLAERNLAASLIARKAGKHPCPQIDMEKAIAWVEGKTGLQLAAQQRQALELACRSRVLVITGGPGVGKTTIINSIAKILRAKKLAVRMAAPTGRAAKRMAEATGGEAKTIHRLLVFDPKPALHGHYPQPQAGGAGGHAESPGHRRQEHGCPPKGDAAEATATGISRTRGRIGTQATRPTSTTKLSLCTWTASG
ncbi:MAG: AAA family ATPase [Planctomycetes bacterium]|nr:AAA family ATPase [Planctomycetota bacterium]